MIVFCSVDKKGRKNRVVKIVNWNLYTGNFLSPVLGLVTPGRFITCPRVRGHSSVYKDQHSVTMYPDFITIFFYYLMLIYLCR